MVQLIVFSNKGVCMERTEAFVRLDWCPDCWLWIVDRCPYCGKQHQHGGGGLASNPREYLGTRVPHCSGIDGKWRSDYRLVERLEEDT
jgi:hypothetical protein